MSKKYEKIKISICCKSDVRYNGYVGLTCYGWTCNRCDRKCQITEVEKEIKRK